MKEYWINVNEYYQHGLEHEVKQHCVAAADFTYKKYNVRIIYRIHVRLK